VAQLRRLIWFTTAIATFGIASAGHCATAPEPTERVPATARILEQAGQWEQACEAYLKVLADNRDQPEIRERLAQCLRRWRQARRNSDPVYCASAGALPLSQALALYSELFAVLERHYSDRSQVTAERLFRHGIDEVRFALNHPSFRREHLNEIDPALLAALNDRLVNDWATRPVADSRDARQLVRDLAWAVHQATGINPSLLVLECAHGACHALDEYTSFVAPGVSALDAQSLSNDLAAYGLTLTARNGGFVIARVAAASWAASEGLVPGDRITHVGKTPIDQLNLDAALELVRGERSTINELTIAPAGMGAARTVVLPEYVPSVFDATIERDGIGYIRLASFQKTTPTEFDSALLRLRSEGMRVLVLDLRGNPGGSFPAAVQVAERFLNQGVIVSTQAQLRGLTKTFTAQAGAPVPDLPLVILVDGDTASASEVLAGALKDQSRAVLVGQPTFGKDTIQRLVQLSEGGAIRLTLARFLLPGGRRFAGLGIAPHVFEPRRQPLQDYQFEAAIAQAQRMLESR
jgi:C-terminal peptidase prc